MTGSGNIAGFVGKVVAFLKTTPTAGDVHVDAPLGSGKKKPAPHGDKAEKRADTRALKTMGEGKAHTPFPFDINAMANIRPDQTPRFFGALTNPENLEDRTVDVDDLVAMQNRVDEGKVKAIRDAGGGGKPPVVVQMNGRLYIADGHHRATAAWLDGAETIPVKFKDLEPVDNALKRGGSDMEAMILKADDEQRMVYGWASVIAEKGEPVVDTQGDVIDGDDLVKATTDFMLDVRKAMVMHERNEAHGIDDEMIKGVVVHSFPLTAELAKSLGIECEREGWIVGVKVNDDEVWKSVKDGTLRAFSIGGHGVREPIT